MEKRIITKDQMHAVAQEIVSKKPKIITLSGPLGAGKTTLVQHILGSLGITEPIQSPTYAYVTTYVTPTGLNIFHFDLYRLRNLQDFIDAGFEEYLYQANSLCLIEWPDIIESLLTHDVCKVVLEYEGSEQRSIQF